MHKDVYFLGAGFSKSVDTNMPLLSDLKRIILETEIGNTWKNLYKYCDSLEDLLSYLGTSFPWEEKSYSLRKKADFLDFSKETSKIIIDATPKKIIPDKLTDSIDALITMFIEKKSHIITLNYDTVLEQLMNIVAKTQNSFERFYPLIITPTQTRSGKGNNVYLGGEHPRIYKLHGSINWYYSGNENYLGEQIFASYDSNDERHISGLTNLIIPPTSDKFNFMNHGLINSLWSLAKKEIELANRVIFIGYSFPESDLMIRNFFNFSIKEDAEIVIVNINDIAFERAKRIFKNPNYLQNDLRNVLECTDPHNPIKKFVETMMR